MGGKIVFEEAFENTFSSQRDKQVYSEKTREMWRAMGWGTW
jgi:hypothetical protein